MRQQIPQPLYSGNRVCLIVSHGHGEFSFIAYDSGKAAVRTYPPDDIDGRWASFPTLEQIGASCPLDLLDHIEDHPDACVIIPVTCAQELLTLIGEEGSETFADLD